VLCASSSFIGAASYILLHLTSTAILPCCEKKQCENYQVKFFKNQKSSADLREKISWKLIYCCSRIVNCDRHMPVGMIRRSRLLGCFQWSAVSCCVSKTAKKIVLFMRWHPRANGSCLVIYF